MTSHPRAGPEGRAFGLAPNEPADHPRSSPSTGHGRPPQNGF
jgi:hypothetical protein